MKAAGDVHTRITDSPFYQHLWGTAEARDVLGDDGRLRGWLEVIVALARAQTGPLRSSPSTHNPAGSTSRTRPSRPGGPRTPCSA
jgi:hypothetical protein